MGERRLKPAFVLITCLFTLWSISKVAEVILPWLIQTIGFTRVTIIMMLIGWSAAMGLIFLINEGRNGHE